MLRGEDDSGPAIERIDRSTASTALEPHSASSWNGDEFEAVDEPCTSERRVRIVATSRDMTRCRAVHRLLDDCHDALRRMQGDRLVIDLMPVEAADTKLAACLVAIYRAALHASVRIELHVSEAVETIISICRLERLLSSHDRMAMSIA